MTAALTVRGLSKRYRELDALRDVGFDVGPGEVVAVLGPNGAGKTTLLSIVAGTQRATRGEVDRDPRQVGWAPQQPAVYSKLSVAENLRLFARLEGVEDPDAAVARMLEQTGLSDRADDAVAALSDGNRQRVSVAIGLLADPPVLALDEPSSSLDPAQRERLWEFVGGLAAGGTAVVFSTHNASEAQRHADRLLVLDAGSVVFEGAAQALLEHVGAAGAGGDLERALVLFLARASPHSPEQRAVSGGESR